jgi:signal transduction histidine kinase
VAFFLLLRGKTAVYFYIAAFDEYLSLALFHHRRLAIGWAFFMVAEVGLAYNFVYPPSEGMPHFLESVPGYLLVCGLAELTVRLWEERERAEKLSRELHAAYLQLQDYTGKAEALAISQERTRLAYEIHDTLGHLLTALRFQLELLRQLPLDQDEARQKALGQAQRLANEAHTETWRAVQALRPLPLETLSLPQALEQLIITFTQRTGRHIQWNQQGKHQTIPKAAALLLYRTLQESLTNIQRHAPEAREISVTLIYM